MSFLEPRDIFAKESSTARQFLCLRASKVNFHVGPGLHYPVDWVVTYKHMPVLVVSSFGQWRRVKMFDGTVDWVHKSLLSTKKTCLTQREVFLHASFAKDSAHMAQLGPNVIVIPIKTKERWVKVLVTTDDSDKLVGWVRVEDLWGETG
ncbi:hypothetical protein AGMMS49949_03740 [Alphaproteobacteria bacterium]|nr:hypothetical protein AGMMS49949_03740 [Alphaproteobacteria bacterium]GHS96577.1 hypothetical protein AGMMS50296_2880 [Alphaproteobacteria bacterium]